MSEDVRECPLFILANTIFFSTIAWMTKGLQIFHRRFPSLRNGDGVIRTKPLCAATF